MTIRQRMESNSLPQPQRSECGGKADLPLSFRPPGPREIITQYVMLFSGMTALLDIRLTFLLDASISPEFLASVYRTVVQFIC